LTLARTLITGGITPELELMLAEGIEIKPSSNSKYRLDNRNRPRIALISILDPKFNKFKVIFLFLKRERKDHRQGIKFIMKLNKRIDCLANFSFIAF